MLIGHTYVLVVCSIAFSPIIVSYTVEILPYSIRAKGFNVFNFTISLALIFNQYVNPIALNKLGWKYYVCIVFSYPHSLSLIQYHHVSCDTDILCMLAGIRGRVLLPIRGRDERSLT